MNNSKSLFLDAECLSDPGFVQGRCQLGIQFIAVLFINNLISKGVVIPWKSDEDRDRSSKYLCQVLAGLAIWRLTMIKIVDLSLKIKYYSLNEDGNLVLPGLRESISKEVFESSAPIGSESTKIVNFHNLSSILIERGLTLKQATSVLAGASPSNLDKIQKICDYFDELVAEKSPKISKSPAGFLFFAVKSPSKFNIPSKGKGQAVPQEEGKSPLDNVILFPAPKKKEGFFKADASLPKDKIIEALRPEYEKYLKSYSMEIYDRMLDEFPEIIDRCFSEYVISGGLSSQIAEVETLRIFRESCAEEVAKEHPEYAPLSKRDWWAIYANDLVAKKRSLGEL